MHPLSDLLLRSFQKKNIMEFEKEFGISIPDDKAEKIGTVGDAIAYIEENAK